MPTKVYCGNLPEGCKDEQIRDVFDPYGEINECHIVKNYAFIHFKEEEDAKKAVADLNDTKMAGNIIHVALSISKGQGSNSRPAFQRDGRRDDRRDDRRGDRRDDRRDSRDGRRGDRRDERRGDRRDDHRDRRDDRRGDGDRERRSRWDNNPQAMGMLGGIGGILATPPNPLGALGALGALTGQSQIQPQLQQSSSEDTENHVPGPVDGFIIYERYYVEPSHPILQGLPLPKVAQQQPQRRVEDSFVAPREEAQPKAYDSQPKAYDSYEQPSTEPARFEEAKDPYAALSAPQAVGNDFSLSNGGNSSMYGRDRSPIGREQPAQRGSDFPPMNAGYGYGN